MLWELKFKIRTYLHKRDILYNHGKLINLWLNDDHGLRDIRGEILSYKLFSSPPGTLIKQLMSGNGNHRGVIS